MKPDDLKPENVGRKVVIDAIGPFENCRATFRAWAKNQKTVIVSLDAPYGKDFKPGKLLEVEIENVRVAAGKGQSAKSEECGYCGGTGEVAESSTRYMACPRCSKK
jgi:hypothetical protein